MAGPYVHCLVLRESLKRLYSDVTLARYQSITNPDEAAPYFSYVCLGAVSPDFPYPALHSHINSNKDTNGWTWGDKFHKQKTGNFIDVGIQQLQKENDKTRESFLKKTAWLMGYYSHVITDLVIHAVVYEIVGGCYENHSQEHLHSEVVQDSMLFYDVYSNPPQELIESSFLKTILEKCQDRSDALPPDPQSTTYAQPYVLDNDIEYLWKFILSQNYSDFYEVETPKMDEWYEIYTELVSIATKVVARIAEPRMAYRKTTDIPDDEKRNYYLNVKLPDKITGDYKKIVFSRAVDQVTRKLKDFLNALDNGNSYVTFKSELGQWNIDKGTVNDLTPQFALWNGQTEFPFDCNGDPPHTS